MPCHGALFRSNSKLCRNYQNTYIFSTLNLHSIHIYHITRVMGRNWVSDDVDYVIQNSRPTKTSKTSSSKLWKLPQFASIKIALSFTFEESINASIISSLYAIFTRFFTDEILQVIVNNTNMYAQLYSSPPTQHARAWESTTVRKLRAYIGAYIWMRMHVESKISDYWRTDASKESLHTQLTKHISRIRWEQINRFFHISLPQLSELHI